MPSPSPIPDSRLRGRAWPALAPGPAARPQPAGTAACLGPGGSSCKRARAPGPHEANYTQIFWRSSFQPKSALAESGAVTKRRAHCAERVPCPQSSGSGANSRGTVCRVPLGGGSHGCCKVQAAVTCKRKTSPVSKISVFRQVWLPCPQTRDLTRR